jgi:excisionase family DNA binding protein
MALRRRHGSRHNAPRRQTPEEFVGDEYRWIGTTEAKRYLGLSLKTLYRLIDQEGLPAYRIGQYIKLRRHEIDAWIAAQRVTPGELEHLYVRVQGRYR